MMAMGPIVSIIMPAYNAAKTIELSVKSVLSQSFNDWELIIIDDQSNDHTVDVIGRFAVSDLRIRLHHSGGRAGAARARNIGIGAARGRYIAFLDSDDLWLPNKLAHQIEFMQKTGCTFCYTGYRKIDEDGVLGRGIVTVPERLNYKDILKTNSVGCLTAIYDAHFYGDVIIPALGRADDYPFWRFFLNGQVVHEDYGLWLKLLKTPGTLALGINEPLALYRVGRNTRSSNKIAAATSQWLIYRHLEKIGLLPAAYYFSHYAVKGFKKYLNR
jgi:teichuronic acid biosynthesis glycosyltransferase TuaG